MTDPTLARHAANPIDVKIKEYWNELWKWTNDNLVAIQTENIADVPHHVFAKPEVKIGGASADGSQVPDF